MVRRLVNQQAVGKKTANGCVVLKPPVLFNGTPERVLFFSLFWRLVSYSGVAKSIHWWRGRGRGRGNEVLMGMEAIRHFIPFPQSTQLLNNQPVLPSLKFYNFPFNSLCFV